MSLLEHTGTGGGLFSWGEDLAHWVPCVSTGFSFASQPRRNKGWLETSLDKAGGLDVEPRRFGVQEGEMAPLPSPDALEEAGTLALLPTANFVLAVGVRPYAMPSTPLTTPSPPLRLLSRHV